MGFDNTIVHNPNSGYSKEARKWDLPKSQGGMRPDHYEHFPKMIYKARRPDSGGPIRCVDPGNEQFSGSNQLTVRSEAELREALENGWRETPQEAVEYATKLEKFISDAAAHRHWEDRNLSEKAKAEAQAHDESSFEHLPAIPEAPLDKMAKARAAKAAKAKQPEN
jgi:hypothetical protein